MMKYKLEVFLKSGNTFHVTIDKDPTEELNLKDTYTLLGDINAEGDADQFPCLINFNCVEAIKMIKKFEEKD